MKCDGDLVLNARSRLYAAFATRFACDGMEGPAVPCELVCLDRVELVLRTQLPKSYREFLATHGPLFVPELWNTIAERDLPNPGPREFLAPATVMRDNELYWSGGMPTDFIGVAMDLGGNLFGFRRLGLFQERPDDLPIFFFDHDYVRIEPIAESFDAWLRWFMDNL